MIVGVQRFVAWLLFGRSAFRTLELVVFSIEDRILDDQWRSVSDAVVRMLGQIRGVFRRVCTRGREFWDDLKAPALQRHFWLRNEPYASSQPLEIATNATALRAHQKRTLSVKSRLVHFAT